MGTILFEYGSWILALHIIAVIAWMAGMLYLPRLFVYHRDTEPGSEMSETFKVMERRLLRGIINPAMIASWLLGILLIWRSGGPADWGYMGEGWMHTKLLGVILLSGVHGVLSAHRKKFERDERPKTVKFYRIINEVPTVLMVVIVFAVVLGTR